MIAIIPAKLNSSRLKEKNIKIFNNKPLIYFTIRSALKSKLIKRVIVSTDSKKIAKIAKKFGAEVPFLRPKKLTRTNVSLQEVCKNMIKYLEKNEKIKADSLIALQPTSPLRTHNDIDKAIRIFRKKKIDYFTSFVKTKPAEWCFYNKKNIFTKIIKKKIKNSQNLKNTYVLNGAIYIYSKKYLFSKPKVRINQSGMVMPLSRSIDIDEINDFKIAEYLIKNKNA